MLEVQTVRVDPQERRAWSCGEEVQLSRKEFDLLHLLLRHAGQIVSRDELMLQVWHTSFWTSSKTIDVHLGWLRRKIGDDARRPHLITTVRGRGLRFEQTAPHRATGSVASGDTGSGSAGTTSTPITPIAPIGGATSGGTGLDAPAPGRPGPVGESGTAGLSSVAQPVSAR